MKGSVLFETAWCVLIFGALLLGAEIAVVKIWNAKLSRLEEKRKSYDGAHEGMDGGKRYEIRN